MLQIYCQHTVISVRMSAIFFCTIQIRQFLAKFCKFVAMKWELYPFEKPLTSEKKIAQYECKKECEGENFQTTKNQVDYRSIYLVEMFPFETENIGIEETHCRLYHFVTQMHRIVHYIPARLFQL